MKASVLYPSQCYLGESPVWHEARKSCLWLDIENGILHELNWETKVVQIWHLNIRVSVIIEHTDGGLILGVQGGIVKFSFTDGCIEWLADIDKDIADNRCNDGACDKNGRIWVGTMNVHCKESAGSLYCVDTDSTVKKKIGGLTIPNGLVWSAENERMYFIDSTARDVKAYLFNNATGEINFEKVVIEIPHKMGMPDGMAIDEEGMLWIAQFSGCCISKWDPQTGKLLDKIKLPVPNVTNCCFVGEGLEHLMITTARENMNEDDLKKYPHSGDVFIVRDVGVKGVRNNKAAHDI